VGLTPSPEQMGHQPILSQIKEQSSFVS